MKKNFDYIKMIFVLSVVTSLSTGLTILYLLWQGLLLDVIYLTPLFALFYPISLVLGLVYGVKYVFQKKSIFELAGMASSGDGLMDNIDLDMGEEE